MDIESDSDTSERWEDFFGSTTELAPSLLGIYDTLTNNLSAGPTTSSSSATTHEAKASSSGDSTPKRSNSNCSSSSDSSASSSTSASVSTSDDQGASYTLAKSSSRSSHPGPPLPPLPLVVAGLRDEPDGAQLSRLVVQRNQSQSGIHGSSSSLASSGSRRGSNIRILSPNVHRIITHSDVQPVEAVSIEALKQQSQRSPTQGRYIKTHSSGSSPVQGAGASSTPKLKLSHIPLSKITGKLSTQSGSELVATFDSSTEYLHSLNFAAAEKLKSGGQVDKDEDRTPTNKSVPGTPFHFDGHPFQATRKLTLPRYDSQQSIKLIEMEQLAATSAQLQQAKPATPGTPGTPTTPTPNPSQKPHPKPKEFVCSEPLSPVDIVDTINFDLVAQHIERLTLADLGALDGPGTELIEAVNKPLVSKPLVRSSSAACASTISSSPLLTYARTKSLGAKASTLGGGVPLKLPTAEQLAELEEANKLSAESLDRLTDIKPKFAARLSELARLNNRPLSSSSICSTSSSSSSGSDQLLNGKLTATSYLASVESLAESENDLGDSHHHPHHHPPAMSVLEKTCLEIVDSERSFVEDLGQVIKGYLNDWKERACLRVDELQILFANIEEIYEFNSMLLQRLVNTGLEPGRIARCFIDLREGFDVYTTYCTSYPQAISLLTKLLQATYTYTLLASTQKGLQHRLPLGSYLLKPVQRILKYHLLLDSLRKHCDLKEVAEAHVIMRQVAHNIDQVKRKQEQQSRVKELSGILDGWLGPELTVLGELRQEGLLMEQHNKPRLVLLFATMLIITKQKEDGRLQFKTYISQNNLMLSEHLPGEPTSFYVIPFDEPRHQIKLTARNRDQKRIWTQHIKGVMLEKLDIPMRAKELVYQLGNEEDRTPDRSTWKWSLHSGSNSTPTYLERRNACRRSEIRQRNSKFKRKTVTNSSSFDSFNESLEQEQEETSPEKPSKPLSRNNSLDDTALQKLAAAMRYRKRDSGIKEETKTPPKETCKCDQEGKQDTCACILRDQRSRSSKSHSPVFSYKALKERSKSVPRIGGFSLDEEAEREREQDEDSAASLRGSKPDLSERKAKGKGFFEVRQYNHKTMPKRIATMKKQRSSTKSCSKFYMDLSEFDSSSATVLKITESTEELRSPETEIELAQEAASLDEPSSDQYYAQAETELLSPAEKSKRDAQIVLDLLKNTKEFERIYNKQQKRRESPVSPVQDTGRGPFQPPPRPPSRSPPPLEVEEQLKKAEEDSVDAVRSEEPIYETLLRNVHVPYKFSPVLGRAKSAQLLKKRSKAAPPAPRPESDYVTLVYSPDGVLQRVGEESVQRDSCSSSSTSSSSGSNGSGSTLKRDSQSTVINLSMETVPKSLVSGSGSESSLLPRALKSIDNLTMAFGRSNRPPERRVSDVSEMCRQSVLHRQGSEAVGERMAHVDYADPKTLFGLAPLLNHSERDSVFSLTSSSSDSMCDQQRKRSGQDQAPASSGSFEYEQQVEDSLENDFRDSAIYSDDNNDKRPGDYELQPRRPTSPPPPPPPLGPRPHSSHSHHQHPPQIAPKPSKDQLRLGAGGNVIVCQSASRSWVLQQIENFNK